MREQIGDHPCFASVAGHHLFRHPETDKWHLKPDPFDPAETACTACITVDGGPVPTGTRAWRVLDVKGTAFEDADVTAREVDAAAAAALEAEHAAAAAAGLAAAVAQVAQAGGGIVISTGLAPALNGNYVLTGELVDGYPAYAAGPDLHLFRHPKLDEWHLDLKPFDPADTGCLAAIPAGGGPVPTGAHNWRIDLGGGLIDAELTAREVA
jgi:hypothetical protein